MRYGKISEVIWMDRTFRNLSDNAKLLYIYLLSCSKCNNIGLFQMGLGTMEDEFGAERDLIRTSLAELEGNGLAHYEGGWVWFNKYLKWNAPISPNHAKQLAYALNECAMRDVPVKSLASFLHSAKMILGGMKTGDGGSYFSIFRNALDMPLMTSYVGGEDNLRNCFDKGLASSQKALAKGSSETFGKQGLWKGLTRATEALGNTETETETEEETETEQKQNRNSSVDVRTRSISVMCDDSQFHEVGKTAVDSICDSHPEWNLQILTVKLQALTIGDPLERPRYEELDRWFLDMCSRFDGERINLLQNRFSAKKGETTPSAKKRQKSGARGANAER